MPDENDNESRRSFMKKGALASSAAALGLTGSGTALGETNLQETLGNALIFSYDYHPGIPFMVVSGLQQPTVNSILGQQPGDVTAPVSDPTDYNGYIIRYQTGSGGIYAFAFIQDVSLQPGARYQFTGSVGFFNTEVNLLSAAVTTLEGEAQNGGGGGNMSNPNV